MEKIKNKSSEIIIEAKNKWDKGSSPPEYKIGNFCNGQNVWVLRGIRSWRHFIMQMNM